MQNFGTAVMQARVVGRQCELTKRASNAQVSKRNNTSKPCTNNLKLTRTKRFSNRKIVLGLSPRASSVNESSPSGETTTERVLRDLEARQGYGTGGAGGAGAGVTWEALQRADKAWEAMRNMKTGEAAGPPLQVVAERPGSAPVGTFDGQVIDEMDVVVCGGTLGIFLAAGLQLQGFKVAVVERGVVAGREQEWNIAWKELEEIIETGVLTKEECQQAIGIEFNPNRCGFYEGKDVWVENILNLGVKPAVLIEKAKQRFLDNGGLLLEKTGLDTVEVYEDSVQLGLSSSDGNRPLNARLILDCMGNFSPIVRQLRWGEKPDGVCLTVGTCSRGFENNTTSDVIYTCEPISSEKQIFWEAFPAGSGPTDRTTYMFTYIDASPSRPSLTEFLEEYWSAMPRYQGVKLEDLEVQRVLFGFFPTYRDSPIRPGFDRVLQVGDASGIQSPLSFGGFGAMARHLDRLLGGVGEALKADCMDKQALGTINPYLPNLSGAWMFQKAMSVDVGVPPPTPNIINQILGANFATMEELGDPVLKPFLQDVVQFGPLAQSLLGVCIKNPILIPNILRSVGPKPIVDWTQHFAALFVYDQLYRNASTITAARKVLPMDKESEFKWNRQVDAWKFGSGNDYK